MSNAEGIEAFPLCWPQGRPRTPRRERSRFNCSFATVRDELMREVAMLGGRQAVLSTNIALRRDGLPYAQQNEPDDPGIAIYFTLRGKQFAFACDRWDRVRDNVQAVRHTIAALRGIERWGTGDMVQAAFTGFAALPPPSSWRTTLGLQPRASLEEAEETYKRLRSLHHPDKGGDPEKFDAINKAIERARSEP